MAAVTTNTISTLRRSWLKGSQAAIDQAGAEVSSRQQRPQTWADSSAPPAQEGLLVQKSGWTLWKDLGAW